MSRVEWHKVTRFSQVVAIILGLLILVLGFYLGTVYQGLRDLLELSR